MQGCGRLECEAVLLVRRETGFALRNGIIPCYERKPLRYSPELNPEEVLNQDVKSNAVGRKRPRSQSGMVSSVRAFLCSRQKQPEKVKCYFKEKHA